MTVTIYHNPNCGTSRNVLAMIRQSGEEPVVIEYLKNPRTRERLKELIAAMGIPVRALLREKGTPYAELGLSDPKWTDDQLLDFHDGASDPDQSADRRDAQGRETVPSFRDGARYSVESLPRTFRQRGRRDCYSWLD
jgi:arsenate reductase (glutaredoxin)